VGGLPQQDLIQALLALAPVGGAYLRGYPAAALWGDQYHLLNAEYRFPVTWIDWAPWTLPVYLRRLSGAVFVDTGAAFFGKGAWKDVGTCDLPAKGKPNVRAKKANLEFSRP